jgi:hypothetical protein
MFICPTVAAAAGQGLCALARLVLCSSARTYKSVLQPSTRHIHVCRPPRGAHRRPVRANSMHRASRTVQPSETASRPSVRPPLMVSAVICQSVDLSICQRLSAVPPSVRRYSADGVSCHLPTCPSVDLSICQSVSCPLPSVRSCAAASFQPWTAGLCSCQLSTCRSVRCQLPSVCNCAAASFQPWTAGLL